jgi:hypothetical protein
MENANVSQSGTAPRRNTRSLIAWEDVLILNSAWRLSHTSKQLSILSKTPLNYILNRRRSISTIKPTVTSDALLLTSSKTSVLAQISRYVPLSQYYLVQSIIIITGVHPPHSARSVRSTYVWLPRLASTVGSKATLWRRPRLAAQRLLACNFLGDCRFLFKKEAGLLFYESISHSRCRGHQTSAP